MGLVRTESQSPEPSAWSNLGEIPPSLSLQQLFPNFSSSSLQGPDVSTYVLNCQVTTCLPVFRSRSKWLEQRTGFRHADVSAFLRQELTLHFQMSGSSGSDALLRSRQSLRETNTS